MSRRARVLLLAVGALALAGGVVWRHALGDRGDRTTAPTTAGLRRVEGRVVVSPERPRIRVEITDPAFRYFGGHRFVLYGVADAEQHVFADADEAGRIRRLYWLQFEAYVPSALFASYDYPSTDDKVVASGLTFFAAGGVRGPATPPPRKGSDSALVRRLLASSGLSLPADVVSERMSWVDASKRAELMFVYLEDLAPLGLTAADLAEGGKAASRFDEVERGVRARLLAGVRLAQ